MKDIVDIEKEKYDSLNDNLQKITSKKNELQKKNELISNKNKEFKGKIDDLLSENNNFKSTLSEKDKEIQLLRSKIKSQDILNQSNRFNVRNDYIDNEESRIHEKKIKNLEKENKELSKKLNKKQNLSKELMSSFSKQSNGPKRTQSVKKINHSVIEQKNIDLHIAPKNFSNKELNILTEYERLNNEFKVKCDDLLKKTAEYESLENLYKYINNVLKQTQKALDETQNDNYILKSENNRLNAEIQTLKIRNKETETLHATVSELKTQKYNLEKQIQDILSADYEQHNTKSRNIRDTIEQKQTESQLGTLNSIISEKTSKISELESQVLRLKTENDQLRSDVAISNTRYEERERERLNYEKQLENFYNKDSEFVKSVQLMHMTVNDKNLRDKLSENDNDYDPKDLNSCNKQIQKLRLEKGKLASELERVQTIISTYKIVEVESSDKHKLEIELLQKQVRAYIARNDQLSKQNDSLLKRIKDLETVSNNVSDRDIANRDVFKRLSDETTKLDVDYNYLEIYIDNANMKEQLIKERIKMVYGKELTTFQSVLTLDFMNNETITSNIVTGNKPSFNTFCRFRFKVDEFAVN